jgi:hypothetical protein
MIDFNDPAVLRRLLLQVEKAAEAETRAERAIDCVQELLRLVEDRLVEAADRIRQVEERAAQERQAMEVRVQLADVRAQALEARARSAKARLERVHEALHDPLPSQLPEDGEEFRGSLH